jgi:hypothetical protein
LDAAEAGFVVLAREGEIYFLIEAEDYGGGEEVFVERGFGVVADSEEVVDAEVMVVDCCFGL